MLTQSSAVRLATEVYLAEIDPTDIPAPSAVEEGLLNAVNAALSAASLKPKYTKLPPYALASILITLHHACVITTDGTSARENALLGFYCETGYNRGIYDVTSKALEALIREYAPLAETKDIKEVSAALSATAPIVSATSDLNLVPVNNGVFDYSTKELYEFTPDWVFTSKSHVNYVPNASNPIIRNDGDGTDWDVESWMAELSDDPRIVELFWQVIGAIIRPNVPWNKVIFPVSMSGNNGKGTLAVLMRNICGAGAWTAIKIADFKRRFTLAALAYVSAVIVDENDTSTYLDDAADFKAAVTGDSLLFENKYERPTVGRFRGIMWQPLNDFPRFRDKTGSLMRRALCIPMNKCFTGREKKYIKEDYLHRREVLEYVLWRVLAGMPNYYELDEPPACLACKDEMRENNDPALAFLLDVLPRISWNLLPWEFLYDAYTAWLSRFAPRSSPLTITVFRRHVKELLSACPEFDGWKVGQQRPQGRMDYPEPLIDELNIVTWLNPDYRGPDIKKKCLPPLAKQNYRGLFRPGGATVAPIDGPSEEPST